MDKTIIIIDNVFLETHMKACRLKMDYHNIVFLFSPNGFTPHIRNILKFCKCLIFNNLS